MEDVPEIEQPERRNKESERLNNLDIELDKIVDFFDGNPREMAKALYANRLSRAAQVSYIIKLNIEKRKLEDKSITDAKTGLINRRGWDEFVEKYEKRRKKLEDPLTVVVADLDNLKDLNDRLGHSVGDILIQESAKLLEGVSRKTDVVSRAGGDEFYLLLPSTKDEGANKFIQRLKNSINSYNSKGQKERRLPPEAKISLSIGYKVVDDNETIEQALETADTNMYEHKRSKKTQNEK